MTLGSWPLECWIFDCAFPRVGAGRLCAKHGWREGEDHPQLVIPLVIESLPPPEPRYARPSPSQDELEELLAAIGPASLGMIALRRGRPKQTVQSTLAVMVRNGRVRRLRHGVYAAVSSWRSRCVS